MIIYPAYMRPPNQRIRKDCFSNTIGRLERMPGRFLDDRLGAFSDSVVGDVRDLKYATRGRFQDCGGSDPFPTMLRHVSGMKSTYVNSITPP
jgi:hypothetical protein